MGRQLLRPLLPVLHPLLQRVRGAAPLRGCQVRRFRVAGTGGHTPAVGDLGHGPPPAETPCPHLQNGNSKLASRGCGRIKWHESGRLPGTVGLGDTALWMFTLLGRAALGSAWLGACSSQLLQTPVGRVRQRPIVQMRKLRPGAGVRGELDAGTAWAFPAGSWRATGSFGSRR